MDNDIATPVAWLPDSDQGYDELNGRPVVSSDGQEIGVVKAVYHPPEAHRPGEKAHYFLLGEGKLIPVPTEATSSTWPKPRFRPLTRSRSSCGGRAMRSSTWAGAVDRPWSTTTAGRDPESLFEAKELWWTQAR
jgi:hypothetical protein